MKKKPVVAKKQIVVKRQARRRTMVDPVKPAKPVKVEKVSVPKEPSRCQALAIAVAKQALGSAKTADDVLVMLQQGFDISDRMWEERAHGRTLPPETPEEVVKREAKEKADEEKAKAEAAADAKAKK
jgi:hypothetical protein